MTENIKDALQYAVELDNQKMVIFDEGGKKYFDRSKATLQELEGIKYADPLQVNSLTGLVDYLHSKFDDVVNRDNDSLLIHVVSPTKVRVYSKLDVDRKRENLIAATASMEKFPYGQFMDSERFIINLQSLFVRDRDAEALLKCASAIRIEGGGDLEDDGVSQTATVKVGAGTKGKAEVPSPAELRPYRSFLEIEQPVSAFIFRINKDGACALFEADGGMWRSYAMESIKEYLEMELHDEIAANHLTIIA
ncbi:hypothetical protein [Enterococcus xiangfangensis]|uniref:hypothetical protein n=1 Tax=Enterococcus xiangfangensis TaxID=1296537 RepID=UPI003D1645CA|nr:hypothetical protein [Enterococcus asini]